MPKKIDRILLTALGKKADSAVYGWRNKSADANLATLALVRLLPKESRPGTILALCTEQACGTFSILEEKIREISEEIVCKKIDIPDGKTEGELWEILHRITEIVPRDCRLTIDLTHGFRSFPFLVLGAGLYLQALKGVQILGVYYGMYEGKDSSGVSPIVDLSPLLNMADLSQAARSFRDTGNAMPFIEYMEKNLEENEEIASKARERLYDWTRDTGSGLVLETGRSACMLKHALSHDMLEFLKKHIPAGDVLVEEIRKVVDPLAFSSDVYFKRNWKEKMTLTLDELMRQAELIEFYIEKSQLIQASGLIREWIISRVLLNSAPNDWLDRKVRDMTGYRLGGLKSCQRHVDIGENPKNLGDLWSTVCRIRNSILHQGMRKDNVNVEETESKLKEVWGKARENLNNDLFWNVNFGGGTGTLLVSGLGLSKGLLFSALMKIPSDECLVIVSQQSLQFIDEIREKSGYKGKICTRVMSDPFTGFKEDKILLDGVEDILLVRDKVVCNITGGTTAQQYIVEEIAKKARNLGREVERVAFVDRRDVNEQRNNPYVIGEIVELDKTDVLGIS